MNPPPGQTTKTALTPVPRPPLRPGPHLATADLLVGLAPEVVAGIFAAGRAHRFKPGHVIYRTGEPATHLYLLISGALNYSRVTANGEEIVLRRLGPGEAFGLGTLLPKPIGYIGTAEAVSECEVHVWDHDWARRFSLAHRELSDNALRIALEYLRLYSNRHLSIVSDSADGRLANTLSGLGVRVGSPSPRGVEVMITNRHLASLADIGPFTASRLLNKWERKGVLEKHRGKVLIRCPEKLVTELQSDTAENASHHTHAH